MQATKPTESITDAQSIVLEGKNLALLVPSNLGFPAHADVRIRKILVNTHSAVIWVKFGDSCCDVEPAEFYPGLRQLALTIDEDCKQMGLVVPVVITLQVPSGGRALDWSQLDTDTDLNSGEFAVRLPQDTTDFRVISADDEQMEEFIATILSRQFAPGRLTQPIRPRNEEDYREVLLQTDFSYRSAMHKELITDYIQPNWKNPENLTTQLGEFVQNMGEISPTNQSIS